MRRFKVVKQIGRGAFGVALLVERKPEAASSKQELDATTTVPQGRYVIKKIDVSCLSKQESAEARNEVHVLSKLAHIKHGNPFIIGYHSAFLESGSLHILLDYAEHGDLSQAISKTKAARRQFRQPQVLDWFIQISSALKFVHSKNILHRDLKTQNVFLDKHWKVKLGDFGIAKVLTSTTAKANTMVGTPYYLSPELCEDKPYDKKSDVWALGCILYELCTLEHAFQGKNMCALVLRIVKGKYAPIKVGRREGYTIDLKNLVDRLLSRNPRGRPYVHEILRLPFVLKHIRSMEMHGRLDAERQIVEAEAANAKEREKDEDAADAAAEQETIDASNWPASHDGSVHGQGDQQHAGSPGLGTRGRALQQAKARRKKKNAATDEEDTERQRRRRAPRSRTSDEEGQRMREMRARQDQLLESSFSVSNAVSSENRVVFGGHPGGGGGGAGGDGDDGRRRNGSSRRTSGEKIQQVEKAWKNQLSRYVGSALNETRFDVHNRVRADIGRSGQKMESRDPTGVQARLIERRRKKERQQKQRRQRQEYRDELRERSKEFKRERAALKSKKREESEHHAKELRRKVKNAKPRVDVKSLRRKFAERSSGSGVDSGADSGSNGGGRSSGGISFVSGVEPSRSSIVGKTALGRMRETTTPPPQNRSFVSNSESNSESGIGRGSRDGRGSSGRRRKKAINDVTVEIFVQPGYSFDMGSDDDQQKEDATMNVSSSPSPSPSPSPSVSSEIQETKQSYVMDTTLSGGLTGSGSGGGSLQDAFEQRRRKRVGKGTPKKSKPSPLSREKNPYRKSATDMLETSSSLVDLAASHNKRTSTPFMDDDDDDDDDNNDEEVDKIFDSRRDDDAPLPWEDRSSVLGDLGNYHPLDGDILDANGKQLHRVMSASRDELANQLRQCAEFARLGGLEGTEDVDDEEMNELESSYAQKTSSVSDPPPVITLSTRCEQLRAQLEVEIGDMACFKRAYKYLHAVMEGDDIEDASVGFHEVIIKGGDVKLSSEESEDLKIEMLLLIHLEGALLKAQRPRQ